MGRQGVWVLWVCLALWLALGQSEARARSRSPVDQFGGVANWSPAGLSGAAEFGQSVALSSNGEVALVGAPGDSRGVGAVWVFTRSGTTWSGQGLKLTPSDESGDGGFGVSVALSSDGDTALIGASGDSGGVGAVWVFTRSGTTWSQGPKLTADNESGNGGFGDSVAVSAGGDTALIGASRDNGGVGAAWVFSRSGTIWSQGPELTASNEKGQAQFGESVALSADGSTALIGGPDDFNSVSGEGAAWVFTRSGATWTQGPKLIGHKPPYSDFNLFGESVALSGDGNTALVGGPEDGNEAGNTHGYGAVWLFARSGGAWTNGPKLKNPEYVDAFGSAVALPAHGKVALIGGSDVTAWRVKHSGSAWTIRRLGLDYFGSDGGVALSSGADTALAGDPHGGYGGVGEAAVFVDFPVARIKKAMIDRVAHRARFKFKSVGARTGFSCALVRRRPHRHHRHQIPSFSPCRSPKTYRHLRRGSYTFLVRAFNPGGEGVPARKRFTIS